jgi:predicted SnoaL-like aldol condensation-catalyzing enzyme
MLSTASVRSNNRQTPSIFFRVEDGKVVEHWDVLQEEVPAADTASGNAMFTIRE